MFLHYLFLLFPASTVTHTYEQGGIYNVLVSAENFVTPTLYQQREVRIYEHIQGEACLGLFVLFCFAANLVVDLYTHCGVYHSIVGGKSKDAAIRIIMF